MAVAERLRRSVRERFADHPVAVSVSVGVATTGAGADQRGGVDARRQPCAVRRQAPRPRPLSPTTRRRSRCSTRSAAPTAPRASSSLPRCCSPRRSTCATSAPPPLARRSAASPSRSPRALGWDLARVERVRAAGILHDIGKLGISDAILHKPGRLDAARVGGDAPPPRARRADPRARRTCATSPPGSLAPPRARRRRAATRAGSRATRSRVEARILAVADAYEAMTADRPYRRGAARGGRARGAARAARDAVRRARRRRVPAGEHVPAERAPPLAPARVHAVTGSLRVT